MGHIHKDIDFVVEAYLVFRNEKVLLVNHKKAGIWLPLGGHIELDEDPEEALFREIEEESGIKRKDIRIIADKPKKKIPGLKFLYQPTFFDIHSLYNYPGHRHTALIYFFRSKTDEIKLKEDEHEDIKWFAKEELADKKYKIPEKVHFFSKEAFRITA